MLKLNILFQAKNVFYLNCVICISFAFKYFFDLVISGFAVGGIYLGKNLVQTLIDSITATKDEVALAKLEIKLSDVPEGKTMLFKWRGKPLYVRHRTDEDIENMKSTNVAELRDPQHDADRTKDPKWLVVIGVCTHLGKTMLYDGLTVIDHA